MSPPLDDRPHNAIESLLQRIPGFGGYLKREQRRESDQLQRRWMADRLQRAKSLLDDRARPLADAGRIDVLPQVDRLRGRLDRLIARIRGAMQGYSGFFDLVQIDELKLDEIYDHDFGMIERVDALVAGLESLPREPDALAEALSEFGAAVDDAERHWNDRDAILRGMTP